MADPALDSAVTAARAELSGMLTTLTDVLRIIAARGPGTAPNPSSSAPANQADVNGTTPVESTLAPTLVALGKLRTAVEAASAEAARRDNEAAAAEAAVTLAERAALEKRKDELRKEVRTKNEKIKVVIDQLRELHRDVVLMLAAYKSLKPQTRAR